MKIIILGAGQVGSSVAAGLVSEDNDITLVDNDSTRLQMINERYDLRIVVGVASHPSVLIKAGAEDADMLLAVTSSDEINMIACQVAYTLFHIPMKIARIREIEYLKNKSLFTQESLPIDFLISPEQLVTDHIRKLISHPGALQVLDFADKKAQMVALNATSSIIVNHSLRELKKQLPHVEYRIVIIYRNNKPIIPNSDTVIEENDEVFFIGSPKSIWQLLQATRSKEKPVKSIMIAGGGNIGIRLAKLLEEDNYRVTLIELDPVQARNASEVLKNTVVLNGDASDEDLLQEENISKKDVFCALTNSDEANIISSMLAKRLGTHKAMSLVNRIAYVDIVQSNTIDIVISPQQITIGSLLAHIRKGDVVVVHALRRGAAEAIEAIAHGDKNSSKVVGRKIKDINLPDSVTIGAIVRSNEVLLADKNTIIEANDHIILMVTNKKHVAEVEVLFETGITFF